MRKTLNWLASMAGLCLVLAACSSEDDIKPSVDEKLVHITFTAGQGFTRTAIDGNNASVINWQEGETISILDGGEKSRQFTLTDGAGKSEGVFDGMAKETNIYTAVYPQASGLTLDGNSVKGAVLPAVQTATAGTFDPKANLMMARTTENSRDLDFRNMTAFVKVTPKMDCQQISIVSADSTEALAGTMTMTLSDDNKATATATATITANASHMVSLMGDIKADSTYFIAVAPGTLAKGFRLGITTADGKHYGKDAKRTSALAANKVLNLGSIELNKMNWLPYVTFSAEGEQSVTLTGRNSPIKEMEYSMDYGRHWASLNMGEEHSFDKQYRFMTRGKNPQGTSTSTAGEYSMFSFSNTSTMVSCTGDIRTLVNGDKYLKADMKEARFADLFNTCIPLTSAPDLPSTELASYCYCRMFYRCVNLKKAPLLPATTLSDNCYTYMFNACAALEESPVLAAEKLASHCYYGMFGDCTSLKKVTMLATSASTDKEGKMNSLDTWLKGTTGGTIYVSKSVKDSKYLTDNIPNGWNIVGQ